MTTQCCLFSGAWWLFYNSVLMQQRLRIAIFRKQCQGLQHIKYVTLFLANFDPLLLSHFVTHPGTLPKSTTHISDPTPRCLVGLVQKSGQKPPVQVLSQLFAGVFVRGFVRGSFVWKVLSRVVFVRSPFCQKTSITTEN